MNDNLGDDQRLLHILDEIGEIEAYTATASLNTFIENSMMRFASIKQIEIIGEAANNITEETKRKFAAVEWRQIIGMRHILVHEYFGIDTQLVWQIIIEDIPKLKIALQAVIFPEI